MQGVFVALRCVALRCVVGGRVLEGERVARDGGGVVPASLTNLVNFRKVHALLYDVPRTRYVYEWIMDGCAPGMTEQCVLTSIRSGVISAVYCPALHLSSRLFTVPPLSWF
jgi:hypothetical protein